MTFASDRCDPLVNQMESIKVNNHKHNNDGGKSYRDPYLLCLMIYHSCQRNECLKTVSDQLFQWHQPKTNHTL